MSGRQLCDENCGRGDYQVPASGTRTRSRMPSPGLEHSSTGVNEHIQEREETGATVKIEKRSDSNFCTFKQKS